MKLYILSLLPAILMGQAFNLIINTKSGEQIKIQTEEIIDMIFEEEAAPEPVQLATPTVTAKLNGTIVNVSWGAVANAKGYSYTIDKGMPSTTQNCSLTLPALPGEHTISVIALGDGNLFLDSEAGKASYSYSTYSVNIATSDITYNSASATFTPSDATVTYKCAIIPTSEASSNSEIINYFKSHTELDAHTGTFTLNATGLLASTNYVAAAYISDGADMVFKKDIRTSANNSFTPGETGSLFAYGCDRNSGWYDVDKIYSNASAIWPGATDGLMCWGCSVAGCLQWWMDEYEKEFGHKPETKYPIPETSQYYTAPMMEIMVSTFPDDAYDALWAYKWFFIPIKNPDGMTNNGHPTFKEDSPYKYGGFLERDQAFVDAYAQKYSAYYIFPTSDTADKIETTFNGLIFDMLESGVVEITVKNGLHSMICWGVDYVVKDDGTRKVTSLWLSENGSPTNKINDLERCEVSYIKGDVALGNGLLNLTSMTLLRSPRVVKLP